MQAVILAGGLGTRLREIILDTPKPLAPIDNKPFLEYLILLLKRNGIKDFVFCLGYKGKMIKDYFKDGSFLGVKIRYSFEKSPLFSAGALKNAENLLEEDFLVVNGDIYFDMDYKNFFEFHKKNNSLISLSGLSIKREFQGMLHRFYLLGEKVKEYYPVRDSEQGNAMFGGVFAINKKLLDLLKKETPASLEKEIIKKCIPLKKVFGKLYDEYLIDIGTPKNYLKFIKDAKELRFLSEI